MKALDVDDGLFSTILEHAAISSNLVTLSSGYADIVICIIHLCIRIKTGTYRDGILYESDHTCHVAAVCYRA